MSPTTYSVSPEGRVLVAGALCLKKLSAFSDQLSAEIFGSRKVEPTGG